MSDRRSAIVTSVDLDELKVQPRMQRDPSTQSRPNHEPEEQVRDVVPVLVVLIECHTCTTTTQIGLEPISRRRISVARARHQKFHRTGRRALIVRLSSCSNCWRLLHCRYSNRTVRRPFSLHSICKRGRPSRPRSTDLEHMFPAQPPTSSAESPLQRSDKD